MFIYLFIYYFLFQIQPNLVNLAAAPISTPAYLPSPPLTGFSSGLTLNASGQESSLVLSHTINPPAGYSSSHSVQGPFPSCSTPIQETTFQVDDKSVPGSTSSEGEAGDIMHRKKHRKRKLQDEEENKDSQVKQAKL